MILSDSNFDLSDNLNDEKISEEVAQNALTCIAQELQRFQTETEESSLHRTDDEDLLTKLYICTTKMQSKNRQLKKLHRNLKMACTVAKIVMSAKNKETEVLEDKLNMKRHECSELLRTGAENISLIEKLQTENANVYQEVEQYYVEFCNERKRCTQLEQRNKFLNNKIVIMENDLAACKEEIQNLKYQNLRLSRSRKLWLKCDTSLTPKSINDESSSQVAVSKSQLNIASHLSAVRDLLCDQDSMLKDLRKLSEELGASEL